MRSAATSNSLSQPTVMQIVGDWNLGVKGFLPAKADRIYSFGGEFDLLLLNGLGGVGFDGGATGFTIRGLGSLDFTRRTNPKDRLPLKLHANLAYQVNNSANVLHDFETTPPSEGGRGRPVERPVRYGLGISRVDAFEIGLGAEYINKWIRPYLEWTIDMPVNRQGYVCNVMGGPKPGRPLPRRRCRVQQCAEPAHPGGRRLSLAGVGPFPVLLRSTSAPAAPRYFSRKPRRKRPTPSGSGSATRWMSCRPNCPNWS